MFLLAKTPWSRCGDTHDELCVERDSVGHSQEVQAWYKIPKSIMRGFKNIWNTLVVEGKRQSPRSCLPQAAFTDRHMMHVLGHSTQDVLATEAEVIEGNVFFRCIFWVNTCPQQAQQQWGGGNNLLKTKPSLLVINDPLLLTPWFCLWGYNRSGDTNIATAAAPNYKR